MTDVSEDYNYDDIAKTPKAKALITHAIRLTDEHVANGEPFDWYRTDDCLYGHYIREVSAIPLDAYSILSGGSHIAMLRANSNASESARMRDWPTIRAQLMLDFGITQDQVDAS